MAFKMKNPSVMKMVKKAGAAMKTKTPMKAGHLDMEAPMKIGHSPKKIMKGDDKKESAMKMKKESGMKLMDKTPKKMKKESTMKMKKKSTMKMKKEMKK
jgi:hypothetical protein